MSQAGRLKITASNLPPTVPTQFTADDMTVAIPNSYNLDIYSRDTEDNNNNGIRTTATGEIVYIELTNRFQNVGTTADNSTATLINYTLSASAAVYLFAFEVVGRDTSSNDGVGIILTASVKTDGVTAALVESNYTEIKTSASLVNVVIDFSASGNDVNLNVTGVVGSTILYNATGRYITI